MIMARQSPLMRIRDKNKIRKALRMRCYKLNRNEAHLLLAWLIEQLELAHGEIESVAILLNQGINQITRSS
jgi:hypothetical protein